MLSRVLFPLCTQYTDIMSSWVTIGSSRLLYSPRTQIAGSITFGKLMAYYDDPHTPLGSGIWLVLACHFD